VRRERAASSFAAMSTSGSKSRVVLIHLMLTHQMPFSSSPERRHCICALIPTVRRLAPPAPRV
jgi:hypothetical protein